jgi:hypothetical protein
MLDMPPDPQMELGGEAAPEPVKDPLDQPGFQAAVRSLIEAAREHMENDIRPAVERAWRYYDGEVDAEPSYALLDEDGSVVYEGSKVVIRECWDRVQQMKPEIARVFLSSDEAVSFIPQTEEDEEYCEQATDYANYVWRVQNDGENLLLDSLDDWSIKFAAIKAYWKEDIRTETHPFHGIDEGAMAILQQEADASIDSVLLAEPRQQMVEQMVADPQTGMPMRQMVPEYVYDGTLRVVAEDKSRICIESIPHDEFLIDPYSQSGQVPLLVGSDCYRTVSDLVAMGVDYEKAAEHKTNAPDSRTANNWGRRQRADQLNQTATGDSSLDYVRVVEAVVQLDGDGDGIAERYRVLCLGDNFELYSADPADDCDYVVGSPFRRAHEPIGAGIAEKLTDLQDIKTSLARASLNNFHRANEPREVVSEDDINAYSDIKTKFGGPVRSSNPASIGFHVVPYVGDKAFPYLDFFDQIGAKRTGISEGGSGLDPDVLKSQTVEAAAAIVAAPQSRMEYLVREYALQIQRPLFKIILRLSVQYQNKPVTARLRNKWVSVDPRGWNAGMDAQPRVGLGTGTRGERMQGLMILLQKQEQLLAAGSPLVDMQGYRQALAELCELLGRKDNTRYFKEMTDEELQAHAQAQQEAAKQQAMEAAQLQAMVEGAKAEGAAKVKAATDIQKAQIDAEAAGKKAQLDADLAARNHDADIQAQREARVMDLEIQREKMAQDYQLELTKLAQTRELKLYELSIEKELEEKRIARKASSGDGNVKEAVN